MIYTNHFKGLDKLEDGVVPSLSVSRLGIVPALATHPTSRTCLDASYYWCASTLKPQGGMAALRRLYYD